MHPIKNHYFFIKFDEARFPLIKISEIRPNIIEQKLSTQT